MTEQTDKEPITADDGLLRKTRALVRCWIEDWGYDMPITDVDAKVEGVIQEAITQHTTTLQAQLEQSEARLALVVEAHRNIIETCGVVNFSSHNQMREAVEGSLALAEEALTATTEQVSSYRESLIQRAENAESALKTYINQNTEKATEISLLKQQVETLLVMVANMQEDGISGIELGDVVRCHLKEKILGQAWKKKDNHPNSKAFHSQGGL